MGNGWFFRIIWTIKTKNTSASGEKWKEEVDDAYIDIESGKDVKKNWCAKTGKTQTQKNRKQLNSHTQTYKCSKKLFLATTINYIKFKGNHFD